ncbi:hypothetical protein MACH26_14380 [Planctobacterium marinum]|uniref:Curli production assembly/transport component CsgG n=2 Tax=Planctobacterium marinum TaxID=1631968 RepID=A0AA48HLU1_9ALTE|nr:hypothetical protein MACH26_14380 [Planctobacterium marinum]
MKTFKFLVLLVSLIGMNQALAKDVAVELTARGMTEEIAIERGLTRAISQVHGVDVDSRSWRLANKLKVNGESNTVVAMENITRMKTRGQIKSYEVLSSFCEDECEVEMRVIVPKYTSPGLSPDKRRKLVVAPFDGRFGKEFSDNLQTHLVQSRRFAVLDREHDTEYQKEKALLLSPDTGLNEKVRLSQVLGLDYLVVGEVSFFDDSRTEFNQFTGERSDIEAFNSEVNYKIINLSTRQVKWQDKTILETDIADLETASRVSRDIINAIYPLKIVSNSHNAVVLNQGGKSLEVGEVFDVFVLGEKLIDPYTKESLGYMEIPVGQIAINRVTAKVSYGSVVEGSIADMVKGSIVRLNTDEVYQDELVPVAVGSDKEHKPAASGGIILPAANKKSEPKPSPQGGVIIDDQN